MSGARTKGLVRSRAAVSGPTGVRIPDVIQRRKALPENFHARGPPPSLEQQRHAVVLLFLYALPRLRSTTMDIGSSSIATLTSTLRRLLVRSQHHHMRWPRLSRAETAARPNAAATVAASS